MTAIWESGPTQAEIEQYRREELARRQSYQDSLLERICDTLWNDAIKIAEIHDGKTTWKGNRISQIVTPEWQQFMCLANSLEEAQDKTRLQVSDIFVVWYSLTQTNRWSPGLVAGTVIQDIESTWQQASWSDAGVWSKLPLRGSYVPDDTASPLDISYTNHYKYTERCSVPDYTISPIDMIAQNPRFGQQWKIMD